MANASYIAHTVGAPSTVPAPPAGLDATFVDAAGHVYTKDSNSNLWVPGLQSTSKAVTAGLNTAETLLHPTLVIPVGLLQVDTVFRCRGSGVNTSTVANLSTFTFRVGTAGTTGDQSVFTATVTSAAAGTAIPFDFDMVVVIDVTGGAGTCKGYFRLNNGGTTGISTVVYNRSQVSGTTLVTTTATNVELTYKSAATTTTSTFDAAVVMEVLPV